MYAYCNNNPVMYVDSEGNSPGLVLGLVVLGAIVVLALTSCSPSSSAEPEAPSNITEEKFTYNYAKSENDIVDGCVNYNVSKEGEVTNIKIYNSIDYTDVEDQTEIIEHIINAHQGEYSDLSTNNTAYYLSEWQAHNATYIGSDAISSVFTSAQIEEIKNRARDVDLNTNDDKATLYKIYGKIIGIYNE